MIKPFPTPDDRVQCHTALQLYAQGKWDRQEMMSFIADVMDKYGISQLRVNNFSIRKTDPIITSTGSWPVVIVIADKQSYGTCPVCGQAEFGYLAGQAPEVTAMCRGCGSIYRREVVEDERTEKGSRSVDMG